MDETEALFSGSLDTLPARPDNPLMNSLGLTDSTEEAQQYLETITRGTSSTERIRSYLEAAPRMMRFMIDSTRVQFTCLGDYPDYYPETEGGKPGGQTSQPNGKSLPPTWISSR